jgi:integrase/recombinase XerD
LPARCAAHGLRKAASRLLAEDGATDREIMSITGHKTADEVTRYTRDVDSERLAENAMAKRRKGEP